MATDHTVCGVIKADNISKLKAFIADLDAKEKKTRADEVEIRAWCQLLDGYVRGEFPWESIFPKAIR